MNRLICASLSLPVALLIGCHSVESNLVTQKGPKEDKQRSGIAYFLPLGKLHITAIRVDSLITNVAALKTIIAVSNYSISVSTTIVARTNAPDLAITNVLVTNRFEISQPKDQVIETNSYQVTITEEYERDLERLYLLRVTAPWTADDQMRIVVGTNGLLTTIGATNTDKTADIIIELAKTAVESFKIAAGGFPTGAGFIKSRKPTYPQRIDIVFNPFEQSSFEQAKADLENAGLSLEFDVSKADYYSGRKPDPTEADGIFYRPMLPYTVTLQGGDQQKITKTVLLPNKAPIFVFEVPRSAFVQRITHATFVNGVLNEVYLQKPSEALQLVKAPVTILQSIVSIPTNLIQLKFDVSTARTKLLNQQSNEVMATVALLEAQRRLLEQQQKGTNSSINPIK